MLSFKHIATFFIILTGFLASLPVFCEDETSIDSSFSKLIASIEKSLSAGKEIDENRKKKFYEYFNLANNDSKAKALPLLHALGSDTFLKLAESNILSPSISPELKTAFWDEISNQIVETWELNESLNTKVLALIEKIRKSGYGDIDQYQKANEIANIIDMHRSMSETFEEYPSIRSQYPEHKKRLLMTEPERYEYDFIKANRLDKPLSANINFIVSKNIEIYHPVILKLLSHEDPGVRMNAALELQGFYNVNYGFDPLATSEDMKTVIEKWEKHVDDFINETPEFIRKRQNNE